jgi:hypothetical protein
MGAKTAPPKSSIYITTTQKKRCISKERKRLLREDEKMILSTDRKASPS